MLQACNDGNTTYCPTPESVGVKLLADFTEDANVVALITTHLIEQGELPSEFYIEMNPIEDGYYAALWHSSAFLQENCGHVGNPGGKSRSYIIKDGNIIEELGWL